MKKLLIATAALAMVAGTAQAQSSVSVYGILDMGYAATSTTATTGVKTDTTGINTGAGLSGNRLGFRGTEDLGGGLKANFVYELGLTPTNATSAHTTRQATVELASANFGSLLIGRANTLGKNTNDGNTAFGGGGNFFQGSVTIDVTSDASALGGTSSTAAIVKPAFDRSSNQVTYTTPTFSGIKLAAQLVNRTSDASDKGGEMTQAAGSSAANAQGFNGMAFQVSYAGNGITAAYTRTDYENETEGTNASTASTKADLKADQYGVTYTMGAFKVFGLYNAVKYKPAASAEVENKGYDIGATYTMGKTTLLASIGDGEIKSTSTTDVKGMQAQVRYALSNRTTAYALYGKTEYEGSRKGESDVTMIGVRHSF
jgi:predicted porin